MRTWLRRLRLYALHAADVVRLRLLVAWHPGLELEPGVSANFAHARFQLAPGARVHIAAGAVTERRRGWLSITAAPGAEIRVGPRVWLRTEVAPVNLVAYEGARLELGPDAFLNGCTVSAKREVRVGERSMIGPGSRVYDADQHDRDAENPEQVAPVAIGAHVWIAADATLLRGVRVGDHAVVATRSVVRADVPPHTLVAGAPATPRGTVGDRSTVR